MIDVAPQCAPSVATSTRFVKRAYRLRRPDQFHRVRREGRSLSSGLVLLSVAPNRRKQTRCGFVVAKRIGNAVVRNRAKRRMREVVRLMFEHLAPGYDLVFVIRQADVATVPFPMLQQTVEQLLRQAGLWREQAFSTG